MTHLIFWGQESDSSVRLIASESRDDLWRHLISFNIVELDKLWLAHTYTKTISYISKRVKHLTHLIFWGQESDSSVRLIASDSRSNLWTHLISFNIEELDKLWLAQTNTKTISYISKRVKHLTHLPYLLGPRKRFLS